MRLRLLLACLVFSHLGFADALPPEIGAALQQSGIPDTHLGLVLQPLDAAAPQLAWGEQRSLNPASVMKLVTTLAALDSLGPAHSWKTRVLYEGEIAHGVLKGTLILQGGGDPSLTLERFWLLLRELRQRGIREIRGDIMLDQTFYLIEPVDPGRFDQLPLKPYNAAPAALMVSQNAVALRLAPEGRKVRAALEPTLATVTVHNQLGLDDQACNGWQDGLGLSLDGRALRLMGRYPSSCGERTLWLNLLPPNETVAEVFAALWRELGGTHKGRILPGPAPAAAQALFEFDSQPLSLIARDINTYSNNVMAKMLLLNLGAARYGAPASWDKGVRAIRAWLAEKRLEMPELVLENGAGLSRIERISAASLARLLAWAPQSPAYYAFAASLPVLGQNGTLKSRLKDSPYAGRAWLKTGSLNGVRNLAGYVLDGQGRRKVLVLLINHDKAEAAGPLQEALIRLAVHPYPQ
ncbi:D-alanyl-D-alanine carboxypeptidase/D-alanyl-D-alanine-endopeptidase (penicillin-binding protein 4) [Sulfuritortus calidifontis]|uniref:D-alanyl-D-alanine carboxypeptidase/D-alanyl-D-alanine-endopeptidase (Penicillin-binding protein 4) n=1 Tax=Sulfuritortus calidifontis TaxID=1914471 RepID=A0A4R3JTV3_9PROT|nr:D-alanyl-D-alanine carboxypeptidase/D-alanyl-D-alanine-endopeptidase [Sulfuritortus calidifontis]TCS69448.1 D-alanyl-D-alanine carboxypeptidase/D-alanyl-D-alanine-endopeptidase (penicillin-binding protein 4) [Sulfuritortus calidifontis]